MNFCFVSDSAISLQSDHIPLNFLHILLKKKIVILFVLKINHKNCDTYLTSSLNSKNKNATHIVNEKETESGGVKRKKREKVKKGLRNDIFKLSDALKF